VKPPSPTPLILGAGVTGLAAGWSSGLPIYEAEGTPGGICASYYLRPGDKTRLHAQPNDGEAYRFEVGGGHWIHWRDQFVFQFIQRLTPVRSYARKSSVFFPDKRLLVPYPIQNNLKFLDLEVTEKVLGEMACGYAQLQSVTTMADWLRGNFGQTLTDLFFGPFHEMYTAGLWKSIAPQDGWKSPADLSLAIRGAFNHVKPAGYNTAFIYPVEGLNALTQGMASRCEVHYGKRVVQIDAQQREMLFADGGRARYGQLISTLPLNQMIRMAGLEVAAKPDPSPSVAVMNIGAHRGAACPDAHWVYLPQSNCGFHRVGFYSNVDSSFLPASAREARDRVGIYVEKSYPEGRKPSPAEQQELCNGIVKQLQAWEWIGDVEAMDPTWIEVAYTWSRPGSNWKDQALNALKERGIFQVGRYARWVCQGIADSIRDGLVAGTALSAMTDRQRGSRA